MQLEEGVGGGEGFGGLDRSVANTPPYYPQLKSKFYRI